MKRKRKKEILQKMQENVGLVRRIPVNDQFQIV